MRRTCFAALALLLVVMISEKSLGQGTSGTLPDPISTHELKGYADRLKLSEPQRQAAHAIHDQYKQEFRALRQGEIANFLKDMRAVSGSNLPKRETLEAFLKKMDLLTGKIAAMDNRMFDQMQAVMTEDQLAQMPRVRMARQRARYTSNQMMMISGRIPVDLSEIFFELDALAEQQQAVDPVLSPYESKLTSALSKLHDATSNTIMKMFEALEAAGFNEESMSNPETAEKMGELMQQIWRDTTGKAMEAGEAVADLNRRTYKSILPMLSSESVRPFRNAYYRRAYPGVAFALNESTTYHDAALKLEGVSDQQREALNASRAACQRKADDFVEDLVALLENSNFSPFDFDSEKMQEYQKKIGEMHAKFPEMRNVAMKEVNDILGEELAKKINQSAVAQAMAGETFESTVVLEESVDGVTTMATATSSEAASSDEGQVEEDFGYDFIPTAISARDLKQYASRLSLNDEQHAILTQLHASYREKFKTIDDNEITAARNAAQALWQWDEAMNSNRGMTPEAIELVYRLRRAAIKAVQELDKAFFDDVEMAVLDDDQASLLKRVRLARERSNCNRGHDMYGSWMGGTNEGRIDLSNFVRRQKLSEAELASIDADLEVYEQTATDAFRARLEAALDLQKAQELWQAEMSKPREEGGNNPMKISAQYQEIVGGPSKRMNEVTATIGTLNRETLDRLVAKLPIDSAHSLRRMFNLRAYPEVYNDELSMEQRFVEVLKLQDLSPEQRRRITDLSEEYRPAYAALCDQMVDLSSGTEMPAFVTGEEEGWKSWQERREAMSSLKFDRNELNLRAISQFRAILTEDHIRRIGGLPEPKKREPYEVW